MRCQLAVHRQLAVLPVAKAAVLGESLVLREEWRGGVRRGEGEQGAFSGFSPFSHYNGFSAFGISAGLKRSEAPAPSASYDSAGGLHEGLLRVGPPRQ